MYCNVLQCNVNRKYLGKRTNFKDLRAHSKKDPLKKFLNIDMLQTFDVHQYSCASGSYNGNCPRINEINAHPEISITRKL